MKKVTTFSMAFCFSICAIANSQDTRITPGVPSDTNGIKTSQELNELPDLAGEECEGSCGEGKSCESSECSCEDCPIMEKALEALPKMVFRVGGEETCCHMTATRIAHESDKKIIYMVGKTKYHDSRDAFESLVRQTESYVKNFVKPRACKDSGSTTVAGESCKCPNAAAKIKETVSTAIKDLHLVYRVGEKNFEKLHDARRFAKKTHQEGSYVIGDEKFEDEYEARLALARQKYRSAIRAVQSAKTCEAEAEAETETTSTDG